MRKVSLRLGVEYLRNERSSAECSPELRVEFDGHFIRTPTVIPLGKEGDGNVAVFEVRAEISERQAEVPPNACIAFESFAYRPNAFGNRCKLDMGTNHITLAEIQHHLRGDSGTYTRTLPLILHTAQNYEKGVIRVTVQRFSDLRLSGLRIQSARIAAHQQRGRGAKPVDLIAYDNSTVDATRNMRETVPGCERMRAPYTFSEAGLESTNGMPLPLVAFGQSEDPRSNDGYWENTLNVVLSRQGKTIGDWAYQTQDEKCRSAAQMMLYQVQYLDYISDEIDCNRAHSTHYMRSLVRGFELFGNGLVCGSGDCEDLGHAIGLIHSAFIKRRFDAVAQPELVEAQNIMRHYFAALSLDGVHGAQVAKKKAVTGAHLNVNFIPVATFRTWLRKTSGGVKVDRELPWDEINARCTTRLENLRFLIGEGTGMAETMGTVSNPVAAIEKCIYALPSMQGNKTPINFKLGGVNDWFLVSLTGAIPDFMNYGSRYGSFDYITIDPRSGECTRGALYTDMMNSKAHARIGVMMHPRVPRDVMNVIREAVTLAASPEPLVYTKDTPDGATNEHLVRALEAGVAKWKRPAGAHADRVPVYIRPGHLDADRIQRMLRDLYAVGGCWKVKATHEQVTDAIEGWRIDVYVKR